MRIIDIDYNKLSANFFDDVVLFQIEKPSSFYDVDDSITMTLRDGRQYSLYKKEFREDNYDRVIPLFKSMVKSMNINQKNYICYPEPPKGWNYYYNFNVIYIMRQEIYLEFQTLLSDIDKAVDKYSSFVLLHGKLINLIENNYKMTLDHNVIYHICLNELIPVFDDFHSSEYVSNHITVKDLINIPNEYLKDVIIYDIEYRYGSSWVNGYDIKIYTQNKPPSWVYGNFGENNSEFNNHKNFAETFSKFTPIEYDDKTLHCSFENPINNFIYYPIENCNGFIQCCWIKKNIYEKYYKSVFLPLKEKTGIKPFYCSDIINKSTFEKG